jgi:diguanylate cyclase (GGDEF)-like protein
MSTAAAQRRLPVLVTPFGPLDAFSVRVHELIIKGHCLAALTATDAFEAIVRLAGDERTLRMLTQARMYAYQALGRYPQALALGRQLVELHGQAGDPVSEAKARADVAETLIRLGRLDEGLHLLAWAAALLSPAGHEYHVRYVSALCSVAEAARAAELYELADLATQTAVQASSRPNEAIELTRAELLVEWGLRLDQLGRGDEAANRFRRGAAIAEHWVRRLDGQGPAAESRWATALLALSWAQLGDPDEAIRLATATVLPARQEGQDYEARLAHLAYGIASRVRGDLDAARREFIAAEQLSAHSGQPTQRLVIQYELALLAVLQCPGPAAGELLSALRSQAEHLWRLRQERRAMLRQAGRRIELEHARARADAEATRDPLTGLGNRRAFDRQLAAIPGAGGGPLVLLLVDLDRFKAVNDAYSHSVGDRVLCDVAATLRAHCRREDIAVRFGGDEFAVFIYADLGVATQIAERIRHALAIRDWHDVALGLRVTASMGAAALRPAMTSRQLYDAADRQLYFAKQNGRNRLAA